MASQLTIDSLGNTLSQWREQRTGNERFPEDIMRAAAILAENSSVAEVAKRLNINHTRLSKAVLLLANERLSVAVDSLPRQSVPRETASTPAMTFTKVIPEKDVHLPDRDPAKGAQGGREILARICVANGVSCEVVSERAFRILCETLLQGAQ